MNTYGGYASLFGLDTSKPLKDQAYSEDQSWDEFFGGLLRGPGVLGIGSAAGRKFLTLFLFSGFYTPFSLFCSRTGDFRLCSKRRAGS